MENLRGFVDIPVETVEFLTLCPEAWKCSNCGVLVPVLWRSLRCYTAKEIAANSRFSSLIINCHHRFCAPCVEKLFAHLAAEANCPFDNSPIKKKELLEERLNIEKLMEKKIHCSHKNRGCRKIIQLRELEEHLKSCVYGAIKCPLKCGEAITIKSLSEHMSNACKRRLVLCEHCQEDISMDSKEIHSRECPKRMIICKHCKAEILLGQVKTHFEECPMKRRNCRFAVIGCEFSGTKDEIDDHEKQWKNHITTIINAIQLRKEPQDNFKNRLGDLVNILKDLNIENETLKTNVQKLSSEMDHLHRQNKHLSNELSKLENNHKNDLNRMKSMIVSLKNEMKKLQSEANNEESEV